jgi:TRAP-type C4-dicarboxylate transport system permease small subunit
VFKSISSFLLRFEISSKLRQIVFRPGLNVSIAWSKLGSRYLSIYLIAPTHHRRKTNGYG